MAFDAGDYVGLPDPPAFDLQDVLMGHQTFMKRIADGPDAVSSLIEEYVAVCVAHADTTTARDTHGDFVVQLEAMRSMLTGQRISKSGGGTEASRVYIVRGEWGREFFTRTVDAWNAITVELAAVTTELASHWAMNIPGETRYKEPVVCSETTLFYEEAGLVLQRYPSIKAAKRYVNALHAVANAPLSRLCIPYACAVEVLGCAFVGLSLVPIKGANTSLTPAQEHLITAVCATLRFVKTAKSTAPPSLRHPEALCACGTDGRFYVLDPQELALKGDTLGHRDYTGFPRRELSFGVTGVATSPSSPVDFALKYRMRPVFEHLLSLTGAAHQSVVSEAFTTKAMHGNGVSITPYFGHVYGMLVDQEKQFQKSHDVMAQQQSTVMRQQFLARKKKFETCRAILLTEAIARVVKRAVRDSWRRLCQDARVLALLAKMVQGEEADVEETENRLNGLFIAAANNVITLCFPSRAPAAMPGQMFSTSNHSVKDPGAPTFTDRDHEVFTELLFVANDAFIKRPLEHDHFKFNGALKDIDYGRAAFCLGEQLGVTVTFDGRRIAVDRHASLVDHFFNLDSPVGGALRTEAVYTNVELPVCFKAHSKAKLPDFAALQLRIAGKLSQDSKTTSEQLLMARFVYLLAADVIAAHRGSAASMDYDEVLASSTDQTVGAALPMLDLDVSFRKALLMGVTEPGVAAKALGRFADKARSVVNTPEDSVIYLSARVVALCRLVEYSSSGVLISMLQGAIDELNALSGYVAPNQRRKVVADPSKTTLRIGQCAHLYLPPLTILVRCVLQPDPSRSKDERIAQAISLSILRRDVIVAIYGGDSYEAGVAADNIGSICSNNKYDLERAEEEFEKAVAILTEAQPEGPAVFVTQNNLAFLYLRKAQMLKENLKGLNERDRVITQNRVRELLEAAETLLRRVIDAESSVAPLDFATACNNLANIMLFRNQYSDATAFFERTLGATEKYANTNEEPHCRLHAQKNLKVLARRRYMNAVLRIQTYVRRFVFKLRNRKTVLQTRAALTVQRCGRAYIERLNGAMKYRFSAFHYWVRQPRVFSNKLPSSSREFAVERRKAHWEEILEENAFRVQRIMRGFTMRHAAGRVVNFQRAYAAKHRAPFELDAERLRALELSKGAISVKTAWAHQQQYELFDVQQRATKTAAGMLSADIRAVEATRIVEVLQEAEYSGRRGISGEWGRVAGEAQHTLQRSLAEAHEVELRLEICRDYYYSLHDVVHASLVLEEQLAFATRVQSAQSVDFVVLLEHRMRHKILRDYEVATRGIQLSLRAPALGRGYLLRRGLGAIRKLRTAERFEREMIESEERVTLSYDALNKRWEYEFHEFNEAAQRRAIEGAADAFWRMEAADPLCVLMKEYRWRQSLAQSEAGELASTQRAFFREAWLAEERARRRALVADAFVASREPIAAFEAACFETLSNHAGVEFRAALLASIDFAISYITSQESRARRAALGDEDAARIDVEAVGVRSYVAATESDALALLLRSEAAARRDTMRRDYLRKVERAARQTIAAYQFRGATSIAQKLRVGVLRITDSAELAARANIDVAQVVERETLHRDAHAAGWAANALGQLIGAEEASLRDVVAAAREEAVASDLTQPMADSLLDVRRSFTSQKALWRARGLVELEEQRGEVELAHFRRAVRIVAGHDEWLQETRGDFDREATSAAEEQARSGVAADEAAARREHVSVHLMAIHEARQGEVVAERAATLLPIHVEREGLRRELLEREQAGVVVLAGAEMAESEGREQLLCEHELCFVSLFLAAMHHKWVTRLWMAQERTLRSSVLNDAWQAINQLVEQSAASRLQRHCRAMSARVEVARVAAEQSAAARVVQRLGRGYAERRALPFRLAEEVEHCMLYASETTVRAALAAEESRARQQLALASQHSPRRVAAASSGSGSRRPSSAKPLNRRLYATPSWAARSSMFQQMQSARSNSSGAAFTPVPPRTPSAGGPAPRQL